MGEFLTIRHSYDDHSYIDGKNDTSLTDRGIEIAKNMSVDEIILIIKEILNEPDNHRSCDYIKENYD